MTPRDEAMIDMLDEQSPYQESQQPSTLCNKSLTTPNTGGLRMSSERERERDVIVRKKNQSNQRVVIGTREVTRTEFNIKWYEENDFAI